MLLINSIYIRNGTEEFVETWLTDDENQKYLRTQARNRDTEQRDKKRRLSILEEHIHEYASSKQREEERAQKRVKRNERIDAVEIQMDRDEVMKMKATELKAQLDKLRRNDTQIPIESRMRTKAEKLRELLLALDRLNTVQ
ncbi:uncharacterized protein FOMMEDRAFT_163827 [Fomitiporia mediterranea MF3/22]|uniref:Uncharacterized protein n=1 Tax=Fomitiporia mediterranea (strain MF3/22) TaxID=694068 RepID=R7SGC7_FOMME|nr:uncharacterized protein FOMMEDRAFT_163827 [Fomitiporia mediterranea MF3/22]EJC97347.1 hypothetical protein FOMMEDRAFT_163827 [Fomitiporia mediterranea MF3/22]